MCCVQRNLLLGVLGVEARAGERERLSPRPAGAHAERDVRLTHHAYGHEPGLVRQDAPAARAAAHRVRALRSPLPLSPFSSTTFTLPAHSALLPRR